LTLFITNEILHGVADLHKIFGFFLIQALFGEAFSLAIGHSTCNLCPYLVTRRKKDGNSKTQTDVFESNKKLSKKQRKTHSKDFLKSKPPKWRIPLEAIRSKLLLSVPSKANHTGGPVLGGLPYLDISFKTKAVVSLATTFDVDFPNKGLQQLVFLGATRHPVIQNFLWDKIFSFFASPLQKGIGLWMGHTIDCFWSGTMRCPLWLSCSRNNPAMVCMLLRSFTSIFMLINAKQQVQEELCVFTWQWQRPVQICK